ncbi:MAG: PD-(D/E)XK nuclease domain-containing protein, partial [Desulfovibrio sp.]|nr:PD-(D/E)XK nuclease domain-containing protein [Desulfovibrio sp.]
YRNSTIDITDLSAKEIEQTKPESFFFQTGYLTIKQRTDTFLILDYPNQEVLSAIAKIYLDTIFPVPGYQRICTNLWSALKERNVSELIRLYNQAIASLPYQDFAKADESTYRALFLMLLRGAGIQAHGEVPTSRGSDVLIESSKHVFCFEFKMAHTEKERAQKALAAERQISQRGYGEPYDERSISLTKAVIVIDVQERKAYGYSVG